METTNHQEQWVLVTGAAGAIGRPVCGELRRRGHRVRGLDRRGAVESADVDEAVVAELTEGQTVRSAMEGVKAVVHLAAAVHETDDFLEKIVPANVVGLHHVMEGARQAGVMRVVLASSMQVVSGMKRNTGLLTAADAAPKNHYALSKVWAERMGEMYARCHGMGVAAARIGWLPRDQADADRIAAKGAGDGYLSHADAGRFFADAVEAQLAPGRFEILYALSRPVRGAVADLATAKRVIGYEPQDKWGEGMFDV